MAKRLIYKGSLNGTSPIYKPFPAGDSQTLHSGDVLALNTGKAVAAADAASAGTILGVGNTEITTTTAGADDIVYIDVNPASIYEIVHSGTATPAVGSKYDFATAPYTLDSDDTDGGFLQVVGNITATTCDVILCNRVFGMA